MKASGARIRGRNAALLRTGGDSLPIYARGFPKTRASGSAKAEKAASLRDFAAALETHTAQLEDSFTIPCDASVIKALKQPSPIGKDQTLLAEFMSTAGCAGSYRYGWETGSVRLSDVSYYAGWRILHLWQNGQTDLLLTREKQTLEAALTLVSGADGSDLEKERYIHDALCDRITYQPEEGSGEKDCATGALLNTDTRTQCCSAADWRGFPADLCTGIPENPRFRERPTGIICGILYASTATGSCAT